MLNEIINETITYITANLEGVKTVDRYRGEFEEGMPYNPNLPAVFIELINSEPKERNRENATVKKSYIFRALVGMEYDCSLLADILFDLLDGATQEITTGQGPEQTTRYLKIFSLRNELIKWENRVEIYQVDFEIY